MLPAGKTSPFSLEGTSRPETVVRSSVLSSDLQGLEEEVKWGQATLKAPPPLLTEPSGAQIWREFGSHSAAQPHAAAPTPPHSGARTVTFLFNTVSILKPSRLSPQWPVSHSLGQYFCPRHPHCLSLFFCVWLIPAPSSCIK